MVANLYHYYQLHRYDGQLLYLKVAAHGTMSVVFVLAVAVFMKFLFPDFHPITIVSEILNVKKTIYYKKV